MGIQYLCRHDDQNQAETSTAYTVCSGSSAPPEKILNIFASEMRFTPFFNYCDILG